MAKITKEDIYYLFDELWPAMMYANQHKSSCLDQFSSIENYFKRYSESNHNQLLEGICSLEGIGITIGTGLIWSAHRNLRIPFDKYTTTYSLKLELIRSDYISKHYVKYSEQIKEYCDEFEIDGRKYEIEDFVREAMEQMEDSEYLIEPK
jgi:endonuclease III-like uncharacterized protein